MRKEFVLEYVEWWVLVVPIRTGGNKGYIYSQNIFHGNNDCVKREKSDAISLQKGTKIKADQKCNVGNGKHQ